MLENELSEDRLDADHLIRCDVSVILPREGLDEWSSEDGEDPHPRSNDRALTIGFHVREETVDADWSEERGDGPHN